MKIHDLLYGSFEIEDFLCELIHTAEVQRLKRIHQGGASYLVNPEWNVTRFEHSMGVMLLIRKLGGSLLEQAAGLLHDLSHTAFSHVVDFVLEHEEQNYHEEIFEEVFYSSKIPGILEKYGYSVHDLLPLAKWGILEQPLPGLCADRIDYTLRDMARYRELPSADIQCFLESLTIVDQSICLTSLPMAEWFTEVYYQEVLGFFLCAENAYGYAVLTEILKAALQEGIIRMEDFRTDDESLWAKIRSSASNRLSDLIESITKKVIEDPEQYDLHIKKKARIIDPPIMMKESCIPSSSLSGRIRSMNEEAIRKSEEGTYIRVLSYPR
ncbi:HD domain-containing protein [Peribacillus kribbensis]|uniref:HD domain-containing protein n=1 Tax=Peribacillus kribbensis TaxID=356658 RepID=UPI00041BAB4B|nr:HD domain-containing protein [Peribacillus kribbensis]